MRKLVLIFFVTALGIGKAQNSIFCKVLENKPRYISVKWYIPQLVSKEGFYIYRKEVDREWQKITTKPVFYKQYRIPENEFQNDRDLFGYVEMASDENNLKGIAFIACLLKSFKSNVFSNYLGIYFEDTTVIHSAIYRYKLTQLVNGNEIEIAVSNEIEAGKYIQDAAPKTIKDSVLKKSVVFKWQPEPQRYYGVNIYKREVDSAFFKKINVEPIILSKTKNIEGQESYPDWFFEDRDVRAKTSYCYRFVAIDFFGQPTKKSVDIIITLKDTEAPSLVDTIFSTVEGKKITYHWTKKIIENDLIGFNIYRTNKNDSDFTKINSSIIPVASRRFEDSTMHFSSYLFKISSLDNDGNERLSNPQIVEVYDNEAPEKPKNIVIAADSGKLTLKWSKNIEEDFKGYLIYRTIDKDNEEAFVKITPKPITETVFEDGLPFNSKNKFIYKIVAVDNTLNRSECSEIVAMRMPDIKAPAAPFLKSLQQQNRNILIEWFSNSENDLLGYEIYKKNVLDSSKSFEKIHNGVLLRTAISFTELENESGSYTYYIVALDSALNQSEASNQITLKYNTESKEEFSGQIKLKYKYDEKKSTVNLRWNTQEGDQLIGYVIYKSHEGEKSLSPITGTIQEKIFTDKEIPDSDLIRYQIRAYNYLGDVLKSPIITINTKKIP